MRKATRRLSRRCGSYSRPTAPPATSVGGRAWDFWQSDAQKEMAAFEQLGPLARQMFDYSLRDISIRKLMQKFVLQNGSGWNGEGAPPPRVCFTDPATDSIFAQFVRDEYRRATGHDIVEMRLEPRVGKRLAERR